MVNSILRTKRKGNLKMQFSNRKAIYLQIADIFFDKILRGKLKPNDRIPSIRELASQLEVTPNTVQKAYQYLQDRGIIYNKRGIGFFVSPEAYEISKELKLKEFKEEELPIFFSQMDALGLTIDQLKELYYQFKNKSK